MHTVLGSNTTDSNFCPEQTSAESLGLLTATVDEEIERVFASLPERRRKRSPLRDVAGMLRSFAYAASAATVLRGVEAPLDWEERARAEFLDGYRQAIELSLVPSGASMDKLLRVFELEKAVYELRYELNNRPDWVRIPVAGIARMLDEELPV
jgi:predicted trehalose synthase